MKFERKGAAPAGGEDAIDIPPELQASVVRHQRHLAGLIASLRSAGLEEAQIEASVHQLVLSYETELMSAIRTVMKAPEDA